jgi:AcrR family transcriptional regulator
MPKLSLQSAAPPNVASGASSRRRIVRTDREVARLGADTKILLMDAGEQLIGRHGFDGVTLRDIAQLAGQANSSVVQYHFKDKAGLIEAILDDRMQRREVLRKGCLDSLKAEGKENNPHLLLESLWAPSLAFKDEAGAHVFCHFALQCLLRADFHVRYPAHEVFETWRTARGRKANNSVLAEVMELLQRYYAGIPLRVLSRRLSALSLMFISNVVEFDNTRPKSRVGTKFDLKPLLDMAIVALSAQQAPP